MSEAAFDTLAIAQRLRNAGFEETQAEAVTFAIRDGITGGVATKADIAEIRADIAEVKAETKVDIAEIKTELKWLKLIGGGILTVLVLPWLAKFISAAMP